MKKILALTLAAVMTAGMTTVAFAEKNETLPVIGVQYSSTTEASTNQYLHVLDADGDATIEYSNKGDVELKGGDQIAIPILLWTDTTKPFNQDTVSSGDSVEWYLMNGSDYSKTPRVGTDLKGDNTKDADVDVRYVDYAVKNGMNGRIMSVVITLPENDSNKVAELYGKIAVGEHRVDPDKAAYTYDLDITYAPDRKDVTTIDDSEYFVTGDTGIVDFDDELGEIDLEFGDEAMFTVDVDGQGRLNLSWNTNFDKEFADWYEYANLDFLTFSGTPSFNRNGYLYIFAPEDAFIYIKGANGAEDAKAEWDEDMEAWRIRTRELTSYVISDVELDEKTVTEDNNSSATEDGNKANPDTGR